MVIALSFMYRVSGKKIMPATIISRVIRAASIVILWRKSTRFAGWVRNALPLTKKGKRIYIRRPSRPSVITNRLDHAVQKQLLKTLHHHYPTIRRGYVLCPLYSQECAVAGGHTFPLEPGLVDHLASENNLQRWSCLKKKKKKKKKKKWWASFSTGQSTLKVSPMTSIWR